MRQLLRHATASSHEALDQRFGSLDLTDRDDYARFLGAHFIGIAALAPTVRAFAADALGVAMPDYPALLADDLDALGVPAARLPRVIVPPALEPAAVAYVVAGSRLGIAGLSRLPSWGSRHAVARAYMEDVEGLHLWRALLGWMAARPLAPAAGEALVASAEAAFAVFAEAFARSGEMTARR